MNKKAEGNLPITLLREVLAYVMAFIAMALFVIVMVEECDRPASAGVKYATVVKALEAGIRWGGAKQITRMKRMWALWYPVLWEECGGRDTAWCAFNILTETAGTGNPFTKTKDTTLGECGLMSVKRSVAKKYNGDCCDPWVNVYMAAKNHQESIEGVWEKYHDTKMFKKMDFADQYLFFALFEKPTCIRSIPQSVAKAMQAKTFPKNHPFFLSMDWLRNMGDELLDPKYDYCWGRNDAITHAFRLGRELGMRNTQIQVYGGGKKGRERWEACVRPLSILEKMPVNKGYPGDKEHGCCCEDCAESAHGMGCWSKWAMPPDYRYKMKGGKKVDLWAGYCLHEGCSHQEVVSEWKRQRMADGTLPSQEQYDNAKAEIMAAGCWIL